MKIRGGVNDRVCRVLTLLLSAVFGLCLQTYAVTQPLNFRHYTIENGMSVNAVYCITQDSKGFMWFGTIDGLNRFDGRNIKQFKASREEQQVDLGNIIYAFCEDGNKQFWIGSDGGLALFDLLTEQFRPFEISTADGTSITSNVTALYADKENKLWIATNGQGVFIYDQSGGSMTQLCHDDSDPQSICSDHIARIYQDSRGVMWLASLASGVSALEVGTGRATNYNLAAPGQKTRTEAIFEDTQGNLWLGNNDRGLVNLNRASGEMTCYLDQNSPDFVRHIRSIVEYAPGILLLASDDGLTFFDTRNKRASTVSASHIDNNGLNDSYLHALYIDRERGLWIASYFGGVNYLSTVNSVNFTNYSYSIVGNSIPGKIVSAFCEDPDGNLWVGTDDAGISFFDTRKRTFTNYKPEKGRNSLSYQNIHALMYNNGKLWIGTYTGGLDIMDVKTKRFTNYQSTSSVRSLCSSSVYAIYQDRLNDIWVGTPIGLNKYNAASDDFERIEPLKGCDITCIAEDNKGNMWVGTFGNGLYRLNVRTGVWREFVVGQSVSANKVSAICVDENERLWVGTTGDGLFSFDYDKEILTPPPYGSAEFASGVIHKIIPDYGYLWISTNRGIMRLNPDKQILKTYNKYDGLPSDQFSPNAGIKTTDGRLWFGGIDGFTCFMPSDLKENKRPPEVTFTNLRIWNREMSSRRDDDARGRYASPLEKAISYTDKLILSHSQSTFSVDFVALSFTAPLKNRYMYRLDGFEKEWNLVGDEPRLSFMNLPSGKYQLQVRASNGDDVWTQEPATLDIVVRPPLWRSLGAYLFYLLVIMSGITYLYYYLIRRTERQHEVNLQRLESSKEKDIYTAKVNFFTNIVHEIRTPLSLIIAPLEAIRKSRGTIESAQEELDVISRNSNRLLKLVNQLMDFRKIEADGFLLKCENYDLVALVKSICSSFESVKNQRINEVNYLLPDHPCMVCVDSDAVEKVISNLFFNAVKFTKNRIEVEVVENRSDGNVELRIKDNGCGISKENLDKIFQPFYQVRETQCSDTIGTGIGLTLALSLTKAMGGELIVHSRINEGAEFIVRLPLLAADCIDLGARTKIVTLEMDPSDGVSMEIPDAKLTLMIVDDNEDLCRFLQKQMQDNYRIILCNDAISALETLKDHHVDLIVCDVMMPGMDGLEFTNIVKNQLETSHIPVLLLTAKANIDAKIEGLESGADVYIEKPFSVDFLSAQISSLIANRDRLRQQFANMPFVSSQTIASSKSDKTLLQRIDEIIERNISESEFSINELAGELCVSRATLFEKVKSVSGLTPNNYIQLKRLKQAACYIESGEYQISEVCYLVGFSSTSYFTKCFKRQFGLLPTEIGRQK